MVDSSFLRRVYALECLLMSINWEFAFVWRFHSVKYKIFRKRTVSIDFSVCLGKFS